MIDDDTLSDAGIAPALPDPVSESNVITQGQFHEIQGPFEGEKAAQEITTAPTEAVLSEDVLAAPIVVEDSPPPVIASPTLPPLPASTSATIRSWAADTFNNLVATGRMREREAESAVQDLLRRLGF